MPLSSLKPSRIQIVFLHDLFMAGLSLPLALYLRLGDDFFGYYSDLYLGGMIALFVVTAAIVFWSQHMYRGVWRYASMPDLIAILRGVTLTELVFLLQIFLWTRLVDFPRSTFLINWFVLCAMLGGPRFIYRILKDRRYLRKFEKALNERVPVLLIGSDDASDLFIRATKNDSSIPYEVKGILSPKKKRVGRMIQTVKILGTVDALEPVMQELSKLPRPPQKVILADDTLSVSTVNTLLDQSEKLGLTLARLPRPDALQSGKAQEMALRPVALEDLLHRPQTRLDLEAMSSLIAGRRVLITGAGGSIGSELVRQIAAFNPAHLTLFEQSEYNLYAIDLELAKRFPDLSRRPIIGDVRNRAYVDRILTEEAPELVFHAAALKHVPMTEYNPLEGILTNAVGSRILAESCRAHDVKAMVMVSTDKAVNPTNVMGATKRLAESCCQALDILESEKDFKDQTRFVTVRFGNVLGSTGSVIPLFQKQLAAGGPLTVTHPDMTRYFMTIREAVELILQAATYGSRKRPEGATEAQKATGGIFVLEMGEPVKIVDLATQLIRLAGLRPEKDITIDFTGLRPGEKLFEEIFHGAEAPVATDMSGILLAEPRLCAYKELSPALDKLEALCRDGDKDAALALLKDLVPEYTADNKG